jgi:hypothetical protein
MIPVVWKSYFDASPNRGYWDQDMLDWLFKQRLPGGFEFEHFEEDDQPRSDGIILVTPGHWRDAGQLNRDIKRYEWALIIVTSDEEGACPYWDVDHPNMILWREYARPNYSYQPDRYLPLGHPTATLEANRELWPHKTTNWMFAGQVTHHRRQEAVAAMRAHITDGLIYETPGFTQGWPRDQYFDETRKAKIVLCPSGPQHPDAFRIYEALECGAVPIIDSRSPAGVRDPWGRTFHTVPPFPIIKDKWKEIRELVPGLLADWPDCQHQAFSWWQQEKRAFVWQIHDDLVALSGGEPQRGINADERITALVPTSPIARHPDTSMILTTIQSIRDRLPYAEILVMVDGIRPEQEHYRERYNEYKTRLLQELNWMPNVTPIVFDEFQHQANMTRYTLEMVRTGLVLFVEHDTPLIGEIPFQQIGHSILDNTFYWVRFHWAPEIHPEHEYLMPGVPVELGYADDITLRYRKTRQWSQRPHLARTDLYRSWIDTIARTSRTMIEDAMYGKLAGGVWGEWRHAIYYPEGDIQRSGNFDGRGDEDPKYEMIYE